MSVHDRVRTQAALIATAAFSVFLPLVLVALVVTSAWTGWVNVMAMHAYLDRPRALPGSMWAVPIAVQTFILVGEVTMVLNSVLRRRWIFASGAACVAAGYAAELGAHLHFGETADAIATMVVAAVASGGGWAMVAALLDRGMQIADSRVGTDQCGQDERRPTTAGRRTRRQLLDSVRALEPDRPTLSPNFVATRLGVSWASAKSLLNEVGRLTSTRDEAPSRAPHKHTLMS